MSYHSLRLLDVLVPEKKLPIQIAQVDRVEIDDVDLSKPGEDEILEQLASDAPSAY